MPSKNMLPKGQRRQSVKAEYRRVRTELEEAKAREAELRARGELPPDDAADDDEGGDAMWETADWAEEALPDPSNPYLRIANTVGTRNEIQTEAERRYPGLKPREAVRPEIQVLEDLEAEEGIRSFSAEPAAAGLRLDAYLAKALPDISRSRVQTLIEAGQVRVDGAVAKPKHKLKGGEAIEIEGEPQRAPLQAEPEDIPLEVVYEDDDLAVVNKPAGMMVHAGAGGVEHNRGTLVNALLFYFGKGLSQVGGQLRPGIVHRLDKDTSGLIVVAKNDSAHRKLGEMFSGRHLRKVYLALVHGALNADEGTVNLPISRDSIRRTRMTTRGKDGRSAVTHWRVLERIDSPWGRFTLLEVHIETGRTHQIRVHMQALGHPVVGDTLYGAPQRVIRKDTGESMELDRNFLHAAELDFSHPRTDEPLELRADLPGELGAVLEQVRG